MIPKSGNRFSEKIMLKGNAPRAAAHRSRFLKTQPTVDSGFGTPAGDPRPGFGTIMPTRSR